MIPLQIKLRNFLSYGAHVQTINFEPYHLICLSGKNGHGKSALLDAITWALWGHARKTGATAKADEGLLRLGQTHMSVVLDLISNGKKYRVQREFVINGGKSHTELHFGLLDDNGICTSLSEKTSRATQQKIIDILGLDYEACVNSIFLRQGQSNEFSNKSAKERKEILANILGINRYEDIRAKALEKAREHNVAHDQLTFMTQHLKEAVAKKPDLLAALVATDSDIAACQAEEKKMNDFHKQLQLEEKQLVEQHHHLVSLTHQKKITLEAYEKKHAELIKIREALRTFRREKKAIDHISSEAEKKELWHAYEQQELLRTALLQAKEQLAAAQATHAGVVQELTRAYHEQLATLAQEFQKKELTAAHHAHQHEQLIKMFDEKKKALAALEKELQTFPLTLEQMQEKSAADEKAIERKKQFYHTFIARGNASAATLKELDHKRTLSDGIETPACPLCEQALSQSRKRFLQEKIIQQEHLIIHQKNRLARIIPLLKQQLIDQHAAYVQLQKERDQLAQLLQHQEKLIAEYTQLSEKCTASVQQKTILEQELTKAREAHALFQKNQEHFFCAHESYIQSLARNAELNNIIKASLYNQARHEELQKLIALVQQQEHAPAASSNFTTYELNKKTFSELIKELKELKLKRAEYADQEKQYAQLPERQAEHAKASSDLEVQRQKNISRTTTLMQLKGGLEQQIKTIVTQEQELAQYATKIKEHLEAQEDYQAIAQALSKNGVQALLIESAIPELEHEANDLLGKLTDNQSHVIIESVRDLKSGGFKETLDIKISDAAGTRPYELFSGGEAFRIDFALRIAISKLLARRSGTSLQTLIIDEGFGSQDEEGLARIMEALYKIQDDFAKIIIVSHLAEMKNQFPTHFVVQKLATGSEITVLEQG